MAMARQEDSAAMLRAAKHLEGYGERPLAVAQGDNCEVSSIDAYWRVLMATRGWSMLPVQFAHSKEEGHAPLPGG